MIKELDFEIKKEDGSLVLYGITEKSSFKVLGYYTTLLGALKGAYKFRKSKKYPGKESANELYLLIKEYETSKTRLNIISNLIYNAIYQLKCRLAK